MIIKAKELASDFNVSFMSIEQDREQIIRKLFVESKPYSDYLKRLMIISEKDCLDDTKHQYQTIVDEYSLSRMTQEGYIRFSPRFPFEEFDKARSYICVLFNDVVPSAANPEFNNIGIQLFCVTPMDYWELNNYQTRAWKMAGYVNGILDKSRLSGIGVLNFAGATEFCFDENLGGVMMTYVGTHSTDDEEKISVVSDGLHG